MFVGAVPMEVISQVLQTVPFNEWGNVWVGCSGSFRFDRAVKIKHPSCKVYSNDVSLLTCSIGALATGREFQILFRDDLAFIEDAIAGADFKRRVAAVMVAGAMGQYTGKNEFARAHFRHYQHHFAELVDQALPKLSTLVAEIAIEDYFAGDFLLQTGRALEHGGGVACFAPTYKGGYERIYKLLNDNVTWPAPEYGMWNPADLPGFVDDLEEKQLPFCVISDQQLEGRAPTTEWRGSNKPVYTYSNNHAASLRRRALPEQPFKYDPIEPAKITATSKVDLRQADNRVMTYLKNVYLAKGIAHVTGNLNYLVFIDDQLVGGFGYSQSRFGDKTSELYLLCDFSISRERKLSKLVAMLTLAKEPIDQVNRRYLFKIDHVATTAFTKNAVSMKYRGIFEKRSRTEDHVQYHGIVRGQTTQEIFNVWYAKYSGADRNTDRQLQAVQPQAAGSERPVHDTDRVRKPRAKHPARRKAHVNAGRLQG